MKRLTLTSVELSIIRALAEGMQSKEIATELGRSRATVEFYVRLLYVKFDARSRAQVVARSYELGILGDSSVRGIRGEVIALRS